MANDQKLTTIGQMRSFAEQQDARDDEQEEQLRSHTHSEYAKVKSPNDMLHNGNEFTFIPDGYTGQVYINHRTASGQANGNVTNYYFGNGKGGLATFIAGYFKGKFQGDSARPIYNNNEVAMLSDVPSFKTITNEQIDEILDS